MAIKNTVSIGFLSTFLDSIGVFDCRLPGVITYLSIFLSLATIYSFDNIAQDKWTSPSPVDHSLYSPLVQTAKLPGPGQGLCEEL